jgi:TldD protein
MGKLFLNKQLSTFSIQKLTLIIIFIITLLVAPSTLVKAQDKLMDILNEEIQREKNELQSQENPPYYISYRVDDEYNAEISSSFGVITKSETKKARILTVAVRVGDYKVDNTHEIRGTWDNWDDYSFTINLPLGDDADGIKQVLWQVTNDMYKTAAAKYEKVRANIAVKVDKEDKSPDFSNEEIEQYYDAPFKPEETGLDLNKWKEKIKKYSLPFLDEQTLYIGNSSFDYKAVRKYFVSTEGAKIAQNLTYTRVFINGEIKADDGMVLPLYKDYFAFKPENIPEDEIIIKDAKAMVKKLQELKKAPVAETFTGPALLSGSASGVFFHEIFGHRVEGQSMKEESDAQTYKKKVGTSILSKDFTVIFDPTINNIDGKDLNGYYKYDDQGIKARKVTVVEKGILKDFLMSRCPIENFSKSNAHGRAEAGLQPVSRQSNLLVKTSHPYTMEELKKKLKAEAKKQGKEYGYLFEEVVGGFTFTGRVIPNSFNVMPVEVYRIYTDNRPDELVRGVDLVGTPLTMFSHVEAAGGKEGMFTGMCGAQSGWVPVSAVSPTLLVTQIETQKKSKSQEKPIILPRPDVHSEQ